MIRAWCRFMDEGKQKCGHSLGLLVLRVAAGGMLLAGHGWGKVENFGAFSGNFPDPLGIGSQTSLVLVIGAEVGCSALLVLGLATRLAAIPLIINMLVAAFIQHAADPFFIPMPPAPPASKELALLFLIPFVTLLLAGPGAISIDAAIRGACGGGKNRKGES